MGRLRGGGNSKEEIIEVCLKLILERNYGTISISDIEAATKLSRGSLFYHFKDKNSIYYAVVDYFMQQITAYYERFIKADYTSLLEFIFAYIDNVQSLNQYVKTLTSGRQSTCVYFLLQAMDFYPGFKEKYGDLYELERKGWEKNIRVAIDRKEIHEDVDVSALIIQFQSQYLGLMVQIGLLPQKYTTTTLQTLMVGLYNDIKVRQEKNCFGIGNPFI